METAQAAERSALSATRTATEQAIYCISLTLRLLFALPKMR